MARGETTIMRALLPIVTFATLAAPPAIAQDCYFSHIQAPAPFMGNSGEIARLSDGSVWEVTASYEYMYQYYPEVIVCPERGVIVVEGKKISVSLLKGALGDGRKEPKKK